MVLILTVIYWYSRRGRPLAGSILTAVVRAAIPRERGVPGGEHGARAAGRVRVVPAPHALAQLLQHLRRHEQQGTAPEPSLLVT